MAPKAPLPSSAPPRRARPALRVGVAAVLLTIAGTTLALRTPGYAMRRVDARAFSPAALVRPPTTVDCVLENGTSTRCLQVVVKYLPDGMKIGPFCPPTVSDVGGIWDWDGTNAGLYRLDASFWRMLDGQGYQFSDRDGRMHIADPSAGRPAYQNACLAVPLDSAVTMTVLLPETPVMAATPMRLGTVGKVGLALDGVPIFSDAPSVLQTGHLPALDTCGGHVDPGGWYHWHATSTDIQTALDHEKVAATCGRPQAADGLFGYAFDGVPLYGSADMNGVAPTGLDACRGHVGPTREDPTGSYHYHASQEFPNLSPCLSGVTARNNFVTTAKAGIGSAMAGGGPGRGRGPGGPPPGGGRRPSGPPPGFAEAAKALGVTEQALMNAVRENGGPRLNFAAAAKALGVSEAALRAALPPPPR